ncbi:hypothetical protein Hanom_Chr05g00448881 [Helianthus anomalus]
MMNSSHDWQTSLGKGFWWLQKYLFCSQHHISPSRAQGSQHLSLRRILFIHKKKLQTYTHILGRTCGQPTHMKDNCFGGRWTFVGGLYADF